MNHILYRPMNDLNSVPSSQPPCEHREESTSVQLSVTDSRNEQSAIPKLNTVLLVSQRFTAECAASPSLLTSFHRYDKFPDASFLLSFTMKPFTDSHASICTPSSPTSDYSYTKSLSNKQDQNRQTCTHSYANAVEMKLK